MALSDNIVSYWKLDGNSNDAVASNNGTDTSITYSDANGIINNGAGFGGSSLVSVANDASLSSDEFSFSFWFKFNPDRTGVIRFIHKENASPSSYSIFIMDTLGIHLTVNGAVSIISNTTSFGTTFHHCVVVADGTNLNIYVDGESDETPVAFSSAINTNTGALTFGNSFDGAMDEVGFWSRALTSTEVTALYNSGDGLQYPFGSSDLEINVNESQSTSEDITGVASLADIKPTETNKKTVKIFQ